MKRCLLNLTAALLTFGLGAVCVTQFRALVFSQPGIFLENPNSQIDLSDEAMLRANLSLMREALGRYKADRAGLHSLDDLVRAGHLKEVPVDPVTGKREWAPEGLGCPSQDGFYFFDITGVRSTSDAVSSDGTRYSEW